MTKAPRSAYTLAKRLRTLHARRKQRTRDNRETRGSRASLTPRQRATVLAKTGKRCHVCGGKITRNEKWHADHVLPHSAGGIHDVDNCLPSCFLCNNYRRHLLPEELQLVLKMGVFVRNEIAKDTTLGQQIATKYVTKEKGRKRRSS